MRGFNNNTMNRLEILCDCDCSEQKHDQKVIAKLRCRLSGVTRNEAHRIECRR